MNVFEAVKQSVTTRQAAEHYGIRVNRNGMACCPFHNDKTPSMKLDKRFHCFGCGADGDVIDFVAALYGLGKKEAAAQLASDFGLAYEDWKPPGRARKPKPRQKSPEEQFREAKAHCFRVLADYLHLLRVWKTDYAPHSPEEAFHPRFVEALQKQAHVEYLLDVQCKNPMSQRRKVCAYTAAGRSEIHDDLRINTFLLLQLMRAPTYSRSTEYADNRISLFSAQWGKCAVTGKKFQCISEIHCHHKKPKGIGGRDKYENLVLVLAPVHELIHAIDEDTIRSYLTALKLDTSQLTKLNKLRTLAKRKPIDLEKPNLTNNSHNGMTKETKKSV